MSRSLRTALAVVAVVAAVAGAAAYRLLDRAPAHAAAALEPPSRAPRQICTTEEVRHETGGRTWTTTEQHCRLAPAHARGATGAGVPGAAPRR